MTAIQLLGWLLFAFGLFLAIGVIVLFVMGVIAWWGQE